MTTYYVDSAGSNTSPYDTWAKAATTLATIAAIDAAGDIIYVASTHSESTAGAVSYAWAGTVASPTKIICGTTAAAPPTTYATSAAIATSGANGLTPVSSGSVVVRGLNFTCGSGTSLAAFIVVAAVGAKVEFIDCTFTCGTTNSGQEARLLTNDSTVIFRNCTFVFSNTSQNIRTTAGKVTLEGCSISGSAITNLNESGSSSIQMYSGCDFSAGATAMNLSSDTAAAMQVNFRYCKLPASWSGSVNSGTVGAGSFFSMHNCDSADTHYRYALKTASGEILSQTSTLVRTGGATDKDGTLISWKCTANANASAGVERLRTGEIHQWNTTTGSAITVTISFLHDSATNLTNGEIWIEVMYLGTSGTPLGSWIRDDVAADNSGNYLATAADQAADSGSTWDTTGMTNPNKQKISVSITPQETGYIVARVAMGTANGKVVYIDPKIVIS